jgi:type I restriction enzyme R subunit
LIELKVPGQQGGTLRGAWNHLRTYATQIPTLQAFPAVHVISTGTQAGMGALGGRFERYAPWKTIDGHRLAPTGASELEVLVRGVFAPAVLLRSLLASKASGGIVFSTMQKFGLGKEDREAGRGFPLLWDRRNIVVIADEAHRTQYDLIDGLARNLRDALPNAAFIGFTGTPIEAADRNTCVIFGEYIDVYDLTQAVEDVATVRVYYEARLRTRVEAVIGASKRIDQVAADIVSHWETRRSVLAGKAMVVGMSRGTCAELYDAIMALPPQWHSDDDDKGTVKVIITGSAADGPELARRVRSKQALHELKAQAKNPDDPLELVIVRDMWLTGFDSPAMHTMYVDKPMRDAGLM